MLLMDGDMELEKGFIDSAITFLEAHLDYAGVAGTVEMDDAANYEFKSRKQRLHEIYPIGDCDHLGGGGLYRRVAIEKIGYLTNRNLHAFEEAELGMRLLHAGYKLHRLDVPYFSHTSHNMPTFKLIMYRWRSGYNQATGELLRSAWRRPYLSHVLRMVKNEIIFSIYMFLLLVSILTFNAEIIGVALLPLLAFIILKAIKNRSLINGLHSVINLAVLSAGLVKGLTHPVRDPMVPPDSKVIHE